MSPKETAYIVERLAVRFMSMVADYERKMVEHRDAFGVRTSADAKIIEGLRRELFMLTGLNDKLIVDREEAWKERDGLLTQVQDMRVEIERLRIEAAKCKAERDDLYQREGIGQKRRMDVEDELTQLHAKGKEAWSDVPNATQWVEEMRGNSEATHDTVQGKAAAESALKTEPVADEIKVGDVAKVVGASGDLTAQSDIGEIGEVLKIDFEDGTVLLSGGAGWVNRCDVRKVTT